MKKKLIAAGAASLAVAAMPVVGVFAAKVTTFNDVVTATIPKACTFEATQGGNTINPNAQADNAQSGDPNTIFERTFTGEVALGTAIELGGTSGAGSASPITINVTCNSTSTAATGNTWTVSAVAGTTSVIESTTYATMDGDNSTHIYSKAATQGGMSPTSGADSVWAFKLASDNGTVATSGTDYGNWAAIPVTTPVAVVSGTPSVDGDATITPTYRVYAGTDQAAGSYTGKVVYTLADPSWQ